MKTDEPFFLTFQVDAADKELVMREVRRLRLTKSEVARRALRVGLERLSHIDFPGAGVERSPDKAHPE